MRDEAEIRGHRRTYIGALPGKIIQSLKKAGSSNPVFLLDEVDKMSTDFRGDPSAALLEVLDPEQNHTFNDHYLDLDYDLSRGHVHLAPRTRCDQIPRPLQDRMEIIQLPGYTEFEKLADRARLPGAEAARGERARARAHRVHRRRRSSSVIRHYTREAGVRSLERELASICRKVAREVVKDGRGQARRA